MDERLDNLFAWQVLAPLTVGFPYLPYTNASMSVVGLAHVLNDVVLNRRTRIIELGGGVSTLLLGRLRNLNKLDFELITIEHDEHWSTSLRGLLEAEGIASSIEVVYAPLSPCTLAQDNARWYDLEVLERHTAGKKFDLALVDGPPAWQLGHNLARFPALPALRDKMAESFSFYLDDINRPGELSIIGKWSEAFGLRFDCSQRTFAVAQVGSSRYCAPLIRAT